jgi:hypothetical protein
LEMDVENSCGPVKGKTVTEEITEYVWIASLCIVMLI